MILGNMVGMFLSKDPERCNWGRYLYFRVLINLNQPLRRGTLVHLKTNNSIWICFKYERLLTFYYSYGYYGRSMKDCEKSLEDKENNKHGLQYGDQLHAFLLRCPNKDNNLDPNSPSMANKSLFHGNKCSLSTRGVDMLKESNIIGASAGVTALEMERCDLGIENFGTIMLDNPQIIVVK